jgi:RNA-directed DNA polymerase
MFRWYVIERLKAWLHRRSQRAKMTWEKFDKIIEYNPIVKPKVYHSI